MHLCVTCSNASTCQSALIYRKPTLRYLADGIILGASKMDHLVANLSACEEGPLDERKSFTTVFPCHFIAHHKLQVW